MEIKDIHEVFLKSAGVSIDTRKIHRDSLFVAIKGERFDANTFAKEALEKGAAAVIIDNQEYYIDQRTILVSDSLKALQELAQYHRDFLNVPIIALTGSNGKTTTKELINIVLSRKFRTKATVGNLNNHIGVPLTILSFDKTTEIGIVEMGANHQKEIEFLCRIARPDYGYITNFGKAHLEGFGGVEGVIKGKSEMYDYLQAHDKTAFINLDDPIQKQKGENLTSYTFAVNNAEADVNIESASANPFVEIGCNGTTIKSNLIGAYNSNNINAAVAIGKYFGVSDQQIKNAIEAYEPDNNRSQILTKGSNEIILDAYNANPSSMAAALENFFNLEKPNKVAVLGDMFELGDDSLSEHRNILLMASPQKNIAFYWVGKDFTVNRMSLPNMHFFASFDDFSEHWKQNLPEKSTILIKGSRGMALERTLDFF
ncbi:MAG TPA: UDP-N-acetylmuramoyl-tripeptide--D-alanyl-D-alanine ligase [Flavobacterium sp.]|jgi:UDP-N-acetylmuramoyl-tripeptide--D-alanyl-D-alanine ligase